MLIVVVWVISVLSILVAALGSRSAFALQVADRFDQQLQASYVALGGVQHALTVLARDPSPDSVGFGDEWTSNELLFAHQPFGDGTLTISYVTPEDDGTLLTRYGLADEERKLNLNTAPEAVLHAFIQDTGRVEAGPALAIAQAILDWRDDDQDPRPMGAEDFYYQGLSPAYESKDGPCESVEELLLIKGMSPALFARLAPSLTVYGSGRVNINTTGQPVLRALGLSETGIKGIVFYRAGEDNTEGTADDRAVGVTAAIPSELSVAVPDEDVNRLRQLVQEDLLSVQSEAFGFSIVGETESGKGRVRVACVVDRDGAIKMWTEE